VGGGTRLKILDAWAMGKAVVSTSVGCEGLAAHDGRNILVRDDPDGFAQAVCDVLHDEPLRRRLGEAARHTVEQYYSWERIGEPMLELYDALCREREPAPLPGAPGS
jgi:glycosyltransferase involved in cell wall biosynthesis